MSHPKWKTDGDPNKRTPYTVPIYEDLMGFVRRLSRKKGTKIYTEINQAVFEYREKLEGGEN